MTVTFFAALSVIVHFVFMPQNAPSPPQPMKVDPAFVTSVRVTLAPCWKATLQMEPQSIPSGFDVTEASPPPWIETLSMYDGIFVKLATTFAAREMLNVHTVVVPQEDASPPQLAN